jgi:hypothetical protein
VVSPAISVATENALLKNPVEEAIREEYGRSKNDSSNDDENGSLTDDLPAVHSAPSREPVFEVVAKLPVADHNC